MYFFKLICERLQKIGGKKMSKHLKGLIVLLLAVLVLAACGGDGSSESNANGDDTSGEEQITINVFQGKVEIKDQFEAMVEVYEEENPNVNIEFVAVGGGSDYIGSLKTRFSSGDEPEIFSIAGPTEAEQFKDYLADLSDTESAQLAFEGTLDSVRDGDAVLGLPYNLEGYGYIYNKEIFENAGVDASSIMTYEDLENAFSTIDSQKDDLGIVAVNALGAKERWIIGAHLANAYLAPEFNNNILEAYNADTVTFERGDELKRMLDLQVEYSVQPTLNIDYSQQVEQYFSLGQVAVIQQGNWIYPSVEQMDPNLAQNLGILPIPVEGLEGKLPVGVPNYWGVNKNKDEATVQAAKDFLDWMNTSEVGKETVTSEFNFIPAYEGYSADMINDPISKEIFRYSEAGETIGWVFNGFPSNSWGDLLGEFMQEYIADGLEWEDVLTNATEKWEEGRN